MARAMSVINENRKDQLSGMSSFRSTSFRLPLGQYSVIMATLGTLREAPTNLHRLGWSSILQGRGDDTDRLRCL